MLCQYVFLRQMRQYRKPLCRYDLPLDISGFLLFYNYHRMQNFCHLDTMYVYVLILTVYRRRFISREGFLLCSQMGTPAELRLIMSEVQP